MGTPRKSSRKRNPFHAKTVPNSAQTVSEREISEVLKTLGVPENLRKHWMSQAGNDREFAAEEFIENLESLLQGSKVSSRQRKKIRAIIERRRRELRTSARKAKHHPKTKMPKNKGYEALSRKYDKIFQRAGFTKKQRLQIYKTLLYARWELHFALRDVKFTTHGPADQQAMMFRAIGLALLEGGRFGMDSETVQSLPELAEASDALLDYYLMRELSETLVEYGGDPEQLLEEYLKQGQEKEKLSDKTIEKLEKIRAQRREDGRKISRNKTRVEEIEAENDEKEEQEILNQHEQMLRQQRAR